jgi:hypothetical protein
MVFITVRLPPGATLESAMRQLDLSREEVDADYGLVAIDPDSGLYGLRVTETASHRVIARTTDTDTYSGPWADPRIEPYGPPQ